MATIETKTLFELTEDEKCWLAFANLGLAKIKEQLEEEKMKWLLNYTTSEIMEMSDIIHAFAVIDYLLEGNLEIEHKKGE